MRLAKTDIIAGLEAPVVRDLMRRLRTPGDTDYLRSRLPGGVDAAAVAEQLFAEGFLELEKGHPAGQAWWITTTKGNALAMASFGKPITRPTADRLLGGLIERAAAWNTNDDRLISVEQLVVFGSYLDPAADRLGDLDIAAALARWPPGADRQDWVKRRLARASQRPHLRNLRRRTVLARRRSKDDAAQPVSGHQGHHRRHPQPHHQICGGLHPGYLA